MENSPLHPWVNYEFQPGFILGFHGCDKKIGEAILQGNVQHLIPSKNDYDWLGTGIYFWEGNPARALQFAQERLEGGRNSQGDIQEPFVLGAIINPGRCLDLADNSAIAQVQESYRQLKKVLRFNNQKLPSNGKELRARRLDCAVFNMLHRIREDAGQASYDTVRGLFWEGSSIYPNAGVREANHIQICVRNNQSVLGYFRPIETP